MDSEKIPQPAGGATDSAAPSGVSRREFLGAAAAFTIVPRAVLGGPRFVAPSDRITLGCVGVGAQGTRVMMDFLKLPEVQVIAVCDVNRETSDYSEWGPNELRNKERKLLGDPSWGSDWKGPTAGREPARRLVEAWYGKQSRNGSYHCSAYNDFHDMLAREKSLDAVVVCTPDHWHASVAIAAMRAGKHVYCQKPMAHSVWEAREMARVARETGVATQVAIGNSASESTRELEEWIQAGVIGPVRRVENWSSRPFWPQGLDRPSQAQPIPEGFDWRLWLGPAPQRPFNHIYLPFVWRGWYDFGCGALGDMGQYSFDTIYRALKLGPVTAVEASSSPLFPEAFPVASLIHYDFPEREGMPPVRVNWYDGGLKPPRPPELEPGRDMSDDHEGLLFVGDHGSILCGFEGEHPQLIPAARMKTFVPPPKTLPRSIGHYQEWVRACKGGPKAEVNFEWAAPLVESLLLGNIAIRTGERLQWEPDSMAIPNSSKAQTLLKPDWRDGWRMG